MLLKLDGDVCIDFLDFQLAPPSTYAKILCDVAKSFLEKHVDKKEIITEKFESLWNQPEEQRGGVINTMGDYLFPFRYKGILSLVQAMEPTHSLKDMEQGKVICIALPASLKAERRYVHTL